MTITEISQSFGRTTTIWENAIDNYSDSGFAFKPGTDSWSVGQVCQHIISSARNYAFKNIPQCMSGNENEHGQKTEVGERTFMANALPDIQIKGDPSLSPPAQPESRLAATNDFALIRRGFYALAAEVEKSNATGKVRHPAFGFLNAKEWLQYMDIHARHHLHQKERIDTFLTTKK